MQYALIMLLFLISCSTAPETQDTCHTYERVFILRHDDGIESFSDYNECTEAMVERKATVGDVTDANCPSFYDNVGCE